MIPTTRPSAEFFQAQREKFFAVRSLATSRNMAAIGLDILNIGSSKWSQDMETNVDYMTSDRAPAQFMLPSVENVSSEIYNS
mgnify:CR=1 FL=1